MKDKVRLRMADLVGWTLDELEAHPQVPIIVECDDGETECIIEEIILSWFCWEYHRKYPKTPKLVSHVMSNITLTPSTHLKYLAVIQKDCYFANKQSEYEELLPYNKIAFQVYNNLWNYMSSKLTRFMTGISILDYIEVLDHPEIAAANAWIQNKQSVTARDIKLTYDKITKVLDTDDSLSDNPLTVAFKHRIVKIAQILQDIGPRGFIGDVDSHIFPKAIKTGYAEGIFELADYIAESRTGSMAEIMTGDPMKESEYLNRLLQLSVSRVKRLHKTDCGSKITHDWYVDSFDKLTDIKGMYYIADETTGRQEAIDPSKHRHLVGKNIQLRTVFGCVHPDREGICAKCFGDLAYNILNTDNIGHLSAIEFQSGQSQQILSFKHHTGSASEFGLYIDDMAQQFLFIDVENYFIYFRGDINFKNLKLKVSHSDFRGFETLSRIDSWEQVSPIRNSRIIEISLITSDGQVLPMEVAFIDNPVNFTMEALKFLKRTEHHVENDGSYVFDMTNWARNEPLFNIPKVQFDVLEYARTLETFIKGPKTGERKNKQLTILNFTDPVLALATLHDMVGQRLRSSVSHLQVLLLSCCCENPSANDYRLPLNRAKGVFESHITIMRNSSASIALGFQTQETDIFDPKFYLDQPRADNPYDYLVLGDNDQM